jgi:hypothetical protein
MKEKNREYYTVGTVPKYNGTNHRNRGMTAHCPGLIQALQLKMMGLN